MKIYHITNYKEKCGIADYAEHLIKALEKNSVESVPLPIRWKEHKYMTGMELDRFYRQIAHSIPEGSVVHLQHEFGFFAGRQGILKSLKVFDSLLSDLNSRKIKTVVTFHSVPPAFVPVTLKNIFRKTKQVRISRAWKKVVSHFNSGSCVAICHNKHTHFELVKRGMPRKAIRILYFPCAENKECHEGVRCLAPSEEAKESLGLSKDSIVLTSFGFISAYKGINMAAEALQCLPKKYVLVLAGDKHPEGSDLSLEKMLRDSKPHFWVKSSSESNRRIIVTGYLNREKIASIWDATDIVLSCYQDVASFSMSAALPEALQSGKPVIASQIPAFREVNEMGNCLAMVAPGASHELALTIQRIAGDDSAKASLVENAQRYAHTHTWEGFATATAALYRELSSGNGIKA
jgi:glycosyltransferase involved in cell wall biosynthesis